MESKSILSYLKAFVEKHNVKREKSITNEVFKFTDGRIYDVNDIIFDIDNEIEVGQIENYSDIGTDSAINVPFKTWYELKQNK